MKVIDAIINKGEWLLDALKRIGYDMIPTNTILDKTLPGLGATHSEINSMRNSIIIEPNVPVILGKLEDNENLEAVYAKCTPHNIKTYLQMDIPYKKIITTPESFKKIRKAANEIGVDIYNEFFCLFDECEKLTQDVDYRTKITQPLYDFFLFKNKAMVSATPLEISHPEIEKQCFQKIKIVPTYDYKKDLELIVTNSFDKSLQRVLEKLKDSKNICIFFNVTDGINELISKLGINDYNIFCSQQSVNKLNKRGIDKTYSFIKCLLANYNFFTCRFYSALDIQLRKNKPDIIILTDLRSAQFTMVDPFTEAIQIQGRFRKNKNDDITYNSLTHITTINPDIVIKTKENIDKKIQRFKKDYNNLKREHELETDEISKDAIFEDMQGLHYKDLLDERGEINPFSIDNLYNEERVKSYYQSSENLYKAYQQTNFFNVTLNDVTECVGDDDLDKLNNTKLDIDKRKLIVSYLEKIDNDYQMGKINFDEKMFYLDCLNGKSDYKETIDAYNKIGKVGMENAQYKKSLIKYAVKEFNKEQAEILRFSPEVLKEIKEEFETGIYIPKSELRKTLQMIYNEHSIEYKVKQNTITDYYDSNESNSRESPSFKLKAFKFR